MKTKEWEVSAVTFSFLCHFQQAFWWGYKGMGNPMCGRPQAVLAIFILIS